MSCSLRLLPLNPADMAQIYEELKPHKDEKALCMCPRAHKADTSRTATMAHSASFVTKQALCNLSKEYFAFCLCSQHSPFLLESGHAAPHARTTCMKLLNLGQGKGYCVNHRVKIGQL